MILFHFCVVTAYMHLQAAHSPSRKAWKMVGGKFRLTEAGGEGKKKGRKLRDTILSLENKVERGLLLICWNLFRQKKKKGCCFPEQIDLCAFVDCPLVCARETPLKSHTFAAGLLKPHLMFPLSLAWVFSVYGTVLRLLPSSRFRIWPAGLISKSLPTDICIWYQAGGEML